VAALVQSGVPSNPWPAILVKRITSAKISHDLFFKNVLFLAAPFCHSAAPFSVKFPWAFLPFTSFTFEFSFLHLFHRHLFHPYVIHLILPTPSPKERKTNQTYGVCRIWTQCLWTKRRCVTHNSTETTHHML